MSISKILKIYCALALLYFHKYLKIIPVHHIFPSFIGFY